MVKAPTISLYIKYFVSGQARERASRITASLFYICNGLTLRYRGRFEIHATSELLK